VQEVRRALEEEGQKIYDEFDVGPPNATAAIQEICRTPFTFGQAHTSEPVAQPLPSQVFFIWQTYVENVDPLIKILHVPTMNEMIRKSKGKFDNFTPGMRALMFAICLAAITSMSESDVGGLLRHVLEKHPG
jgi:hypothetical protein